MSLLKKLKQLKDETVIVTGRLPSHAKASMKFGEWMDMWYQYYCEMNIPKVPSVPGNYELTIYYNGLYTGKVDITIE